MRRHCLRSGFTLLELSVVLLIFSLMLGGILAVVTQETRRTKQKQLAERMTAIETALMTYRKANNKLPCPANIALRQTETYFGIQGATPGTCTGGTPAATFSDSNTVAGGVPTKTLGLPDEYAFDPWENHFLYVVDKRITAASAFLTYPPSNTTIGVIRIKDAEDDTLLTNGLYLLLSHGPNGHGAYTHSGVRKSSGSTNAFEQVNCHCNASATATAFNYNFYLLKETPSSSSGLAGFDDVVRYGLRRQMLSASEQVTEKRL